MFLHISLPGRQVGRPIRNKGLGLRDWGSRLGRFHKIGVRYLHRYKGICLAICRLKGASVIYVGTCRQIHGIYICW